MTKRVYPKENPPFGMGVGSDSPASDCVSGWNLGGDESMICQKATPSCFGHAARSLIQIRMRGPESSITQ